MKYAVKSMIKYLGEDDQIKIYDNVDDAVQAAKDFAETIRFLLSAHNGKPYGLVIQMMPFDYNKDLLIA